MARITPLNHENLNYFKSIGTDFTRALLQEDRIWQIPENERIGVVEELHNEGSLDKAIRLLEYTFREGGEFNAQLSKQMLRGLLAQTPGFSLKNRLQFPVSKLLEYLEEHSPNDETVLLQLSYFRLLPQYPQSNLLFRRLNADAELFSQIVTDVFSLEQSAPEILRATSLLNLETITMSWQGIPGQVDSDDIDESALMEWISTVREPHVGTEQLRRVDTLIGRIIGPNSEDLERGWPSFVLCESVERIQSVAMEEGIYTRLKATCDVDVRDFYTGGKPERERLSQLEQAASGIRPQYGRMKRIVDELVRYLKQRSQDEDRQVDLTALLM